MFISGQPVPVDAIAPELLPNVGPGAPHKAKLLTARAALPMAPERLGWALAILARDPAPEIAETARKSMRDLPPDVLTSVAAADLPGPVLDCFAHVFIDELDVLRPIVSNRATLNETIRWIARQARGPVLDYIAGNQVRLIEEPAIIEALIANPGSTTPTLAYVVETALRSDIDTSQIVGFAPLAQAFFADLAATKAKQRAAREARDEAGDLEEDQPLTPEELEAGELSSSLAEGVDDELMAMLLSGGAPGMGDGAGHSKPLWKLVGEMSLPQKVRLAMLGGVEARRLLVHDPRKLVAQSVLHSAKLTDKEVAAFAMDKSLDSDVVRYIANNRQWTRNYSIMLSLVWNPKCPAQQASIFIKSLHRKDLQVLARAKEVPTYVSRAAKQVAEQRKW